MRWFRRPSVFISPISWVDDFDDIIRYAREIVA